MNIRKIAISGKLLVPEVLDIADFTVSGDEIPCRRADAHCRLIIGQCSAY
jgi:hypothetical protein